MQLSLYNLKRTALAPRTAYRRRKEKDLDGVSRALFELHSYRKPAYDFFGAAMTNPDLLWQVDLNADGVAMDVGAFSGEWTQKVLDLYGATVYAFEPAPSGFQRTTRRFADDKRVHVFDYGLGGSDLEASLALSGLGSSIYGAPGEAGSVDVKIRDIAVVLEELELTEIDVLKVNIEGGEYDLFDRLEETGWLPRIDQILVQFHEWHPKAYRRRRAIRRALLAQHHEVWNYPWCWEYWRRSE